MRRKQIARFFSLSNINVGKLSEYMSQKRDLAFDYERELRGVRDLIHGVTRRSGADCAIDLSSTDGFVAGGDARAAFSERLQAAIHNVLLRYAEDLARGWTTVLTKRTSSTLTVSDRKNPGGGRPKARAGA